VLEEFGRVGFLLIFALAFPLIPIVASFAFGILKLRPRRPDPVKNDTYECGVETEGDAWGQFRVQYYVYALVFVVFDVEVLLLYPWAVSFGAAGVGGFVAGALFLLILTAGFLYDWAKKALEWT
jgi:NADH-quinone oxidoreductase subunit A